MLAFVLVTEVLRLANRRAGQDVFTWEMRAATVGPVAASNNQTLVPDVVGWHDTVKPDLVLVIAGYEPLAHLPSGLRAFLARADRAEATLGGIDTGVTVLATLGLLGNEAVVLHQEAEAAFRETWPDIPIASGIYALDGRRMSTAGGTATADAMLAWISERYSSELARTVTEDLVHGSLRASTERQRLPATHELVAQEMDRLMRSHMEFPLQIQRISDRLAVTEKVLRVRSLRAFGRKPIEHYLRLRLDHAHSLLLSSNMTLTEIAFAVGFKSHTNFSRAYKKAFDLAPGEVRRRLWLNDRR